MGDFVHLQRNPEFRSKTDLQNEFQFNPVNRRHSVQITCGTVRNTYLFCLKRVF